PRAGEGRATLTEVPRSWTARGAECTNRDAPSGRHRSAGLPRSGTGARMTPTGRAKRLWALDGPTLTHDRSHLVVGETGIITFPVPCFLIEHARGLVLFDTGLVPEAAVDARKIYGEMAEACGIAFRPEQAVDRQIEALGFRTGDVTHVLMSHAHWD